MAGTGLQLSDYPEPDVEVWPEAWPAFTAFSENATQWRVSAGGASGLDYGAVRASLREAGVAGEARRESMRHIRVLERAALTIMHEDDHG